LKKSNSWDRIFFDGFGGMGLPAHTGSPVWGEEQAGHFGVVRHNGAMAGGGEIEGICWGKIILK